MSSTALFRWAGLANVVAAVLLIGGELLHPANQPANVATSAWTTAHVVLLGSLVLGTAGLFGLYLRQFRDVGTIGFVGFLLIFLAMALFLGIVYFEAFFNPILISDAPAFVEKLFSPQPPGSLALLLPLNGLAFSLGWLLFGIATARANVLPRLAAIVATVGAIPFGVEPLLPGAVGKVVAVVFGVGVLWLGYALWSEKTLPAPSTMVASRPAVR